ncbi:MAG: hypothetical protein HYX72_06315 [Acidobacteria bacterium]|nr:hypothetical protein [Acidobacteriota bacterium]
MSSEFIAEDLARFIVERIDSVAQLEALLLLRANPAQYWAIESLAQRLYIGESQTAEVIARLAADGIVAANGREPPQYSYQPATNELRLLVDRLAETYAKHLVPVTNLIHSKPRTRIQEFADAFKLRKDTK